MCRSCARISNVFAWSGAGHKEDEQREEEPRNESERAAKPECLTSAEQHPEARIDEAKVEHGDPQPKPAAKFSQGLPRPAAPGDCPWVEPMTTVWHGVNLASVAP